jgi:hypothetical protein
MGSLMGSLMAGVTDGRGHGVKPAAACRMYGVAMPAEGGGYHAHAALYDAELAGRLYFAMRGIAYATAAARPALFVRRS